MDNDGFRKYVPDPAAKGVMAAKVDHPFQVKASWGDLSGKAGDFIVKSFDDKDVEFPDSVWLVDMELFEKTYEKVDD
jgi:hypothetical protein